MIKMYRQLIGQEGTVTWEYGDNGLECTVMLDDLQGTILVTIHTLFPRIMHSM